MNVHELSLRPELFRAIEELGFVDLTGIQEKCIPLIQQGKDLVGQSATGSGKTATFGLPLLDRLEPGHGIQALILTPTRELCVQVTQAMIDFAKYLPVRFVSIYGGVSMEPQLEGIKRADVVVGTPGRVLDHLGRSSLDLTKVTYLVLDEADKMFEMGFIEDVEEIVHHIPKDRQTLLFSATMPDKIHHLITKHLRQPAWVKSEVYVDKSLLRQVYYNVGQGDKFSLLVHLLKKKRDGVTLVFCGTRNIADVVAKNLRLQGIHALAIHGGLSQNKRTNAMESLRSEKIDVLVATDVAARGIDIRNISFVVNYDVPKTSLTYVHRIGRTARAGDAGDAVTLLASHDHENFYHVLEDRSLDIKKEEMPKFERVAFVRTLRHGQKGFRRGYSQTRGRFGGERRDSKGYGHRSRDGASRDDRKGLRGFGKDDVRGGRGKRGFGKSRFRRARF